MAETKPTFYRVGESKQDGMSAQVWRGDACICIICRETSARANVAAQLIADALNGAMRLHEIKAIADDTHTFLIENLDDHAEGFNQSLGALGEIVTLIQFPDETGVDDA